MSYRKNILIWGDGNALIHIIEQNIRDTPELAGFSILGRVEYGHTSLVTADVLRSADIVLYGLFCRHGTRLRAEGVPALGARLKTGRQGMIYGVGIAPVASNPLIWDIANSKPLATKLTNLGAIPNPVGCWEILNAYFAESIFSVDGHR